MRISFGGGGTDLEAYYATYGGLVVSTAINKYFYAVITTDESDDLQVISADYRSLFRHSPYNDLFWNGDRESMSFYDYVSISLDVYRNSLPMAPQPVVEAASNMK